jgi:hypothetical protein
VVPGSARQQPLERGAVRDQLGVGLAVPGRWCGARPARPRAGGAGPAVRCPAACSSAAWSSLAGGAVRGLLAAADGTFPHDVGFVYDLARKPTD